MRNSNRKNMSSILFEEVTKSNTNTYNITKEVLHEDASVISLEEDSYELTPRFDRANSFYGKARVEENGDEITLISYSTPILTIKDHKIHMLCGEDALSQTTMRHVRDFLKQMDYENKIDLSGSQPITKSWVASLIGQDEASSEELNEAVTVGDLLSEIDNALSISEIEGIKDKFKNELDKKIIDDEINAIEAEYGDIYSMDEDSDEYQNILQELKDCISSDFSGEENNMVEAAEKINIINAEDKEDSNKKLFKVSLWSGKGQDTSDFYAYGVDDESALNAVVEYCEKKQPDLLISTDDMEKIVEDDYSDEFASFKQETGSSDWMEFVDTDLDYKYVDGADDAYYVREENLKIEEVESNLTESTTILTEAPEDEEEFEATDAALDEPIENETAEEPTEEELTDEEYEEEAEEDNEDTIKDDIEEPFYANTPEFDELRDILVDLDYRLFLINDNMVCIGRLNGPDIEFLTSNNTSVDNDLERSDSNETADEVEERAEENGEDSFEYMWVKAPDSLDKFLNQINVVYLSPDMSDEDKEQYAGIEASHESVMNYLMNELPEDLRDEHEAEQMEDAQEEIPEEIPMEPAEDFEAEEAPIEEPTEEETLEDEEEEK